MRPPAIEAIPETYVTANNSSPLNTLYDSNETRRVLVCQQRTGEPGDERG